MKHYGDITKIKGSDVPIVDIVTGGSPCQDLSVAGKRAGLDGERSGLFMEQVRVFKEMRDESIRQLSMRGADVDVRHIRPRFFVWENVPGAFSSNKGEDFRCVLEEVCRIADKDATVPMPEKGKWSTSGCIVGDGYSVAWRVHDAQFWGVPQRRRRISLVADFGGLSAPEILFEREGLSRDTTESREQGQGAATTSEGNAVEAISFQERAECDGGAKESSYNATESEPCQHLTTNQYCKVYGISSYDSNAMKSANPHSGIYEADTSRTLDLNGGSPACNQGGMVVLEGNGSRPSHQGDGYKESEVSYTLNSTEQHAVCWDGGQISPTLTQRMPDKENFNSVIAFDAYQHHGYRKSETIGTITRDGNAGVRGDTPLVTYGLDRASFNQGKNAKYDFQVEVERIGTQVAKGLGAVCKTYQDVAGTLCARISAGTSNQLAQDDMFVADHSVVRRLTPMECERLQGFPDGWTDIGDWVDSKGKTHKGESDSPRYKALGNSIALPFWEWMAARMVRVLMEDGTEHPTMASLFDGIGGFPLVYSRCGCDPVWASEIEEFPIAVTKVRFPEEGV